VTNITKLLIFTRVFKPSGSRLDIGINSQLNNALVIV